MYCLRNLDKALPSLKEIGLLHRTNATKIKAEFKKAFGKTIYQFHLEERLKWAALLLQTCPQKKYPENAALPVLHIFPDVLKRTTIKLLYPTGNSKKGFTGKILDFGVKVTFKNCTDL